MRGSGTALGDGGGGVLWLERRRRVGDELLLEEERAVELGRVRDHTRGLVELRG